MGLLTTIYDAFTTNVAAAVAAQSNKYRQLPNPYDIGSNNGLYLSKGFGIAVKPGRGRELERGTKRGRERTFQVVLTQQVVHLESDLAGAKAADKALIEDILAVEKSLELDNSLGGKVCKIDYIDDSGVLPLPTPSAAKYLQLTCNFLVLYEETIY